MVMQRRAPSGTPSIHHDLQRRTKQQHKALPASKNTPAPPRPILPREEHPSTTLSHFAAPIPLPPPAPPSRSAGISTCSTSGHLKPKRPAGRKRAAPPPPTHGKIPKPCPAPVRENLKWTTTKVRSRSDGTHTHPPPKRSRHEEAPSCPAIPPLPPPSRSSLGAAAHPKPAHPAPPRPSVATTPAPPPSTLVGAVCSAIHSHLKPGTRVRVRTATKAKIDGKTLVLWLGATVVSAADGGYEVVYEGNLPRDDPFSTVHLPLHHVRPFETSPPSHPPSAVANSSASATNTVAPAPKRLKTLPAARPMTAGKSIRLVRRMFQA